MGKNPSAATVAVVSTARSVFAHPSVSKFHAYVRRHGAQLALYDAASANGTFADDQRVAVKGRGAPTELSSGMRLRFGLVDVIFLSGADLRQLADSLSQPTTGQTQPHRA